MKRIEIPEYAERILKIDSVGLFQARIWPAIQDLAEKFNFYGETQTVILEWCVIEIYKEAFQKINIRLSNHYRYDEGKLVIDNFDKEVISTYADMIVPKYEKYRNSKAKIMISGTNALVSIERNS